MLILKTNPYFDRRYKKLSTIVQEKADRRSKIFAANPFDQRLDTHKLHGERKYEWAYSIDYSYRIAFVFLGNNEVLYTDIGTHDELY